MKQGNIHYVFTFMYMFLNFYNSTSLDNRDEKLDAVGNPLYCIM